MAHAPDNQVAVVANRDGDLWAIIEHLCNSLERVGIPIHQCATCAWVDLASAKDWKTCSVCHSKLCGSCVQLALGGFGPGMHPARVARVVRDVGVRTLYCEDCFKRAHTGD